MIPYLRDALAAIDQDRLVRFITSRRWFGAKDRAVASASLRDVAVLTDEPAALVRKDKRFKELELDASDYTTRDEVIAVLLAHPELMERPVVFVGEQAVIARPSERVLELLEN